MFSRIFVAAVLVAVASANFFPADFSLDSIKRPSPSNYGGSGVEPTPASNHQNDHIPSNTVDSSHPQEEPLVKLTFSVSKLRQLLASTNVGSSGTITINVPESAVAMAPSPTTITTTVPAHQPSVSVSRRSGQPRGAVRELPSSASTAANQQ